VKSRIALSVLAALASMPVMAAEPTGVYFGFDLGQSSYDVDMGDAETELLDWLEDSGLSVLEASNETSESAFTWGLHLGYQIWPYLAVEAGYIDLGGAEYKARGVVTDGIATSDVEIAATMDSSGFVVSGLGMVPLGGSGWDVFGRVGMYFGSNDIEGSLTVDDVVDTGQDDTSSQSFMWGAGISYTSGQWTSRLEYQQYTDVGDDGDVEGIDVDRIVFGAVYRTDFGAWHSAAR
jgi:opacity protein-like surface antigen